MARLDANDRSVIAITSCCDFSYRRMMIAGQYSSQ